MKILLYHNMIAPYRHVLFQDIAARTPFHVLYGCTRTRDRKWSVSIPPGYGHSVLKSSQIYWRNRALVIGWNLGEALRSHEDAGCIIATYTRGNIIDLWRLCRWAGKRRVPFILWVGDVDYVDATLDEVGATVSGVYDRVAGYFLARASGFLAYSSRSVEWIRKRGGHAPVIVGTQVFHRSVEAPRPGRPQADLRRLLYVGKLEYRKGFDLLVAALRVIPKSVSQGVAVRVVGDGPMGSLITEELTQRFAAFTWEKEVGFECMPGVYRDADICVVPSRHDPWGNVTSEALVVGTPVICSKLAGSSDVAQTGGWVVDPCNVAQLASTISMALQDPALTVECRERAWASVCQRTTGQFASRLVEFVQSLASDASVGQRANMGPR